jgi:UTP--glucose-1-phosphate uridylyltransferase
MIRKAIIPVAGLGTRLLSATKEQPKEMLPLFFANEHGSLCLKPIVQEIFERLFDFGAREFYFIVGKQKRPIEDHFTPDFEFVHRLNDCGKNDQALQLESFYERIKASTIVWVNQPEPKGFGDAVLQVECLVGREPFLLNAGDTYIVSGRRDVPAWLAEVHAKGQAQATLTLKEVQEPRHYGVAEVLETEGESLDVKRVVEKPSHPTSRLAIMPLYIFNPTIFEALRNTGPGVGGEIQLTDAIQKLIDAGQRVQAVKLSSDDIRVEVGTPETYWEALKLSHDFALSKKDTTKQRETVVAPSAGRPRGGCQFEV